MQEPAIEMTNLGKVYPGGIQALDEVSFRTGYGEVFGYLGRNGSGKTTTIRILTTLTAATTGTARVAGHDVARDPAAVHRSIGVTMQQAALDETMTGRELLRFLAALWELPSAVAEPGSARWWTASGLAACSTGASPPTRAAPAAESTWPAPCSTGRPCLFLDEPTTGLDPQSRRALWEQVRELRDQGSAIFLTTQYLEEAAELADRIAILQAGRLVAQDTPAGLRRRHGGLRLRLRLDQQPPATPSWASNGQGPDQRGWMTRPVSSVDQARTVLDELVHSGAPIAEVHLDGPTLEDAYLALTGSQPSTTPPAAMAAART